MPSLNAENRPILYSHHIFLFPFVWIQQGASDDPNSTDFDNLVTAIIDGEESKWESTAFEIDRVLNYNEYNYFYEYVREVLYDLETIEKKGEDNQRKKTYSTLWSNRNDNVGIIKHLRFDPKGEKEWKYYIKLDHDGKPETPDFDYCLDVDSIFLHLYQTGVGVISIHLNNYNEKQSYPEDILRINQFGRRVYPPYFSLDPELIGTKEAFESQDFTKIGYQLPIGLAVSRDDKSKDERNQWLNQSFAAYRKKKEDFQGDNKPIFLQNPFHLPPFIAEPFLGKVISTIPDNNTKFLITPALDDRMFVVCWYGNDEISNRLKPYSQIIDHKKRVRRSEKGLNKFEKNTVYPHKTDEWWYRYTFVDGTEATCQNDEMLEGLLTKATNARWAKNGQFFGVTSFSFVLLTPTLSTLRRTGRAFVVPPLQTMYYKMVELVLVQRASVQHFSDQVADISKLPDSREDISEKIGDLYKQYIRFVNKIFFREVTAQTQGKELYNMLLEQSSIEKYVKDLDSEINELHNYVLQVTDQSRLKEEKKINQLISQVSLVFLGPSILIAFYGISIFPNLEGPSAFWPIICLLLSLIIITYLSGKIIQKPGKDFKLETIVRISCYWFAGMLIPLFFFPFVKEDKDVSISVKDLEESMKRQLKLEQKVIQLQAKMDSLQRLKQQPIPKGKSNK